MYVISYQWKDDPTEHKEIMSSLDTLLDTIDALLRHPDKVIISIRISVKTS